MKNITIIFALLIASNFLLHAQDTLEITSDWNLIGATSTVSLDHLRSEPAGIIISSYFGYSSSGYSAKDTLEKGKGYWVRANQAGLIVSTPSTLSPLVQSIDDTMEVTPGWNTIGAISTISRNKLRSEPAGIIISSYFGYSSSGYSSADTLKKGRGYWVKASQGGIIVSTPLPLYPAMPSNPDPANEAINVSILPILSWNCSDPENDPLTYDVYLDIVNPPATIVSTGQSETSCAVGWLPAGTTFYWKVVAQDNHSYSTSGAVWSFTTEPLTGSACAGTPTVWYAGKLYNTVRIGSQCWLRENLNVGIMIDSLQNQANNKDIEKYCYQNNPAHCSTYGGLYQWNEAMQYSTTEGARGICPPGWHIPTYNDYFNLRIVVNYDGNALKAVGQGTEDGAGTNVSGFSALLSGYKNYYNDHFINLSYVTYLWSSSVFTGTAAFFLHLNTYNDDVYLLNYNYEGGFAVRCLKD